MTEILKCGGWSSKSTFVNYYLRDVESSTQVKHVKSPAHNQDRLQQVPPPEKFVPKKFQNTVRAQTANSIRWKKYARFWRLDGQEGNDSGNITCTLSNSTKVSNKSKTRSSKKSAKGPILLHTKSHEFRSINPGNDSKHNAHKPDTFSKLSTIQHTNLSKCVRPSIKTMNIKTRKNDALGTDISTSQMAKHRSTTTHTFTNNSDCIPISISPPHTITHQTMSPVTVSKTIRNQDELVPSPGYYEVVEADPQVVSAEDPIHQELSIYDGKDDVIVHDQTSLQDNTVVILSQTHTTIQSTASVVPFSEDQQILVHLTDQDTIAYPTAQILDLPIECQNELDLSGSIDLQIVEEQINESTSQNIQKLQNTSAPMLIPVIDLMADNSSSMDSNDTVDNTHNMLELDNSDLPLIIDLDEETHVDEETWSNSATEALTNTSPPAGYGHDKGKHPTAGYEHDKAEHNNCLPSSSQKRTSFPELRSILQNQESMIVHQLLQKPEATYPLSGDHLNSMFTVDNDYILEPPPDFHDNKPGIQAVPDTGPQEMKTDRSDSDINYAKCIELLEKHMTPDYPFRPLLRKRRCDPVRGKTVMCPICEYHYFKDYIREHITAHSIKPAYD